VTRRHFAVADDIETTAQPGQCPNTAAVDSLSWRREDGPAEPGLVESLEVIGQRVMGIDIKRGAGNLLPRLTATCLAIMPGPT